MSEKDKYKDFIWRMVINKVPKFKHLIDDISGIITDLTFNITKDKITVKKMPETETGSIFINMAIHADKVAEYYFNHKKDVLNVSVRSTKLNKVIKTFNSGDIIVMFVHSTEPDKLCITREMPSKNCSGTTRIGTIDINIRQLKDLPDTNYDTVVSLPSTFFQKVCKDNNSLGCKTMSLKFHKSMLTLASENKEEDIADSKVLKASTETLKFLVDKKPNSIIQGEYLLKKLITFTKCTNLSQTVRVYASNNLPLQLEYNIGDMGKIKLYMAAMVKDE